MHYLVGASLFLLCLGSFLSISLMAVSHILITIPILFSLNWKNFKKLPASAFALLGLCFFIVLSIILNQDLIKDDYKNIFKIKYYLIGALSIIPIKAFILDKLDSSQKKKLFTFLFYSFLISCILATISGLIAMLTGFNFIRMKETSQIGRNSGAFGMLVTYAHQASLASAILSPLLFLNQKKLSISVNKTILYLCYGLNFIGVILSYTRGAIIAVLIDLSVKKKKVFAILTILLSLTLGSLFISNKTFLMDKILRAGSMQRLNFWQGAIQGIKEKPIIGYGFRNFQDHSVELQKKAGVIKIHNGHAHNNFFEIWATTGTLGFSLFILWIFLWFKESRTYPIQIKGSTQSILLVFIIGGLTQATFIDGENLFLLMGYYSIASALYLDKTKSVS